MKRFVPAAILLLIVFACGKKEEPAPEPPPTPATETAPQAEPSPAVPPQASAEPATPSAEKAKPTEGKYIVARGDTLYSIAKKNGLNDRDLAKWNKIKDPRRLRVGQELRLTAPGK
jgi:LysM repeat protein